MSILHGGPPEIRSYSLCVLEVGVLVWKCVGEPLSISPIVCQRERGRCGEVKEGVGRP